MINRNHTSILVRILHAKYKKCAKSIMDSEYVLWTYKIHCFVTPTNNIGRKFICFYIYHIRVCTYKIIKKNSYKFYTKVTGSYKLSAPNLLSTGVFVM